MVLPPLRFISPYLSKRLALTSLLQKGFGNRRHLLILESVSMLVVKKEII